MHVESAHIDAVEGDASLCHVVETQQQTHNRALSRAGRADERHRLACRNREPQPAQNFVRLPVAEVHVVELNGADVRADSPHRKLLGALGRLHCRLRRQHFVHAHERCCGSLAERDHHSDVAQRPHEHREIHVERDEIADAHVAIHHSMAAVAEHGDQPERRQQVDCRQEPAADSRSLQRHLADVIGFLAQLLELHVLGAETFHDAHARHALFHHAGKLRLLVLHREHRRVDARREPPRCDVDERQRCERDNREAPVGGDENHGDRDELRDVAQRDRDHHHELLHLLQVARGAAHQLARLRAVVVAHVQSLDVGIDPLAQHRLGPAALAECEIAAPRGEQAR